MTCLAVIALKVSILSGQNAMVSLCCVKSEYSVETQCYILNFVALQKAVSLYNMPGLVKHLI